MTDKPRAVSEELEAGRREVQTTLDQERSALERNQMGQFATPADLALDIARYAVQFLPDGRSIRFLEPAVGSGSFFSALLQTVEPSQISSAIGVELDGRFAEAAESIWSTAGLEVRRGDFTAEYGSISDATLVLTNPPYVRHHHLSGADKKRLSSETLDGAGIKTSGLSGLYVYFLLLCHPCMADDAVAAWLIPTEFMDVNYGSALRQYLSERVELLRVHRFDPSDLQFEDAIVSSAVVVFRNRRPKSDHSAELSFGGTLTEPTYIESVSVAGLRQARKWPAVEAPRAKPRRSVVKLGDLLEVKRGIATGANSFFIMGRGRAAELEIPAEFLTPILPSPRYMGHQVVDAGPDGWPLVEPELALLDCDLPEEEVRATYPSLAEYLDTGVLSGIGDRYLTSKRSPWFKQEKRQPPPFLSTYMGRGRGESRPFRFIRNKSKAVATNVYLMLYPKPLLRRAIEASDDGYSLVHKYLESLDGDALRAEGRVYGGGLHKMEPGELVLMDASPLVDLMPTLSSDPSFEEAMAQRRESQETLFS